VILCRHKLPIGDDPSTVPKLKTQLQQAEEKVRLFESKMKDAEEDAHVKAQEVSSQGALKILFRYERKQS
jgi:hypothetical protein